MVRFPNIPPRRGGTDIVSYRSIGVGEVAGGVGGEPGGGRRAGESEVGVCEMEFESGRFRFSKVKGRSVIGEVTDSSQVLERGTDIGGFAGVNEVTLVDVLAQAGWKEVGNVCARGM